MKVSWCLKCSPLPPIATSAKHRHLCSRLLSFDHALVTEHLNQISMGSTENFARLRDIAVHDSCRVNDDHSTPSGKGKEHKGLKGLTARGILSTPPPPESYGRLEIMFAVAQGIAILMFGLFTEYAEGVHPIFTNSDTTTTDTMQSMYAFFQDVHVMIFIGFGFLMTFLKTANWSALCFTWVISIWALQWGILSNGLWHQVPLCRL